MNKGLRLPRPVRPCRHRHPCVGEKALMNKGLRPLILFRGARVDAGVGEKALMNKGLRQVVEFDIRVPSGTWVRRASPSLFNQPEQAK